jgi:hypothetical protein
MAKKKIDSDLLIEAYSNYLLKHGKRPSSVFVLCEELKISEKEFYAFFPNLDKIESHLISQFCTQTRDLLHKSEDFKLHDAKTKLLSFYYTVFEQMNLNRSLMLTLLNASKYQLDSLKKFDGFKASFRQFIHDLDIKTINIPEENLAKIQQKGLFALAWFQFLATLKFWLDDESPNFEQTDIFIEKSVQASFDLVELSALKNIFDFGKFIWAERFSKA